jgi:hypothetical protein
MDEFKRTSIGSSVQAAVGDVIALFGIVMCITAFFPWNIGLLLRGIGYFALAVGYRYLAVERIINLKLNILHHSLASEEQSRFNRFDVLSIIFKLVGNIMFCGGMILLAFAAYKYLVLKYLPLEYLDISLGLEAAGLTLISIGVLYNINNKFDDIWEGICDMRKDIKEIEEKEQIIHKRLNRTTRKVKKRNMQDKVL